MSIEQKIAQLLEESKKLQEEETITEEVEEVEEGIAEAITIDEGHGVFMKGGSVADQPTKPVKVYDNLADAKAHAARLNKALSPGEKKHYGIKYHTKITESHIADIDVSEDVAALVNGEELSEEFKTKAATIFEAAVVTRVKQEVTRLEEEFDVRLEEEVIAIKEGLIEKVDGYLNYVVEQWMTDNELALEHGMKNEILESFVSGMKGLFEQHYIEVPEEKFDVLGEMQEHVEAVEAKLDEQVAINVELNKQISEMTRENAVDEFASDMADTDAEKFRGLAEELAYEDSESFKLKLQTIKENYFGKKHATSVQSVVTDTPVALTEDVKKAPAHSPQMQQYLRVLGAMK